jgi:mediator of RNA polymerase II transcription subunit 12
LDQDILQPLAERLAFLLNGLMDTHPESFISPKMWMKYKKLLNLYLPLNSPHMSITLESIDRRHGRLNPQSKQKNTSRRRKLIELLDKSLACPFPTGLSKECRHLEPDLFLLARTILDWSTSPHRPGPTKVFVATRLLRMWSRLGVDISDVVLEFLGSEDQSSRLCKPSLYHVVSELTRSGHFSVSRYLQWLIARGGVRGTADLEKDGPCTTRLLVELSMKELPDSMEKLRRTMLIRASASVDHELQEIQSHVAAIERYLPDPRGSIEAEPSGYNNLRNEPASVIRAGLSRATKSDMGAWIRKRVSLYMVSSAATSDSRWRDVTDSELRCAITSHEFNIVRGVLEEIEDLSMLADVLKTITHSVDLPVLAAVADTLNYHVETFAAIGALDDLFEKLLMRLRSLPDDGDTTVLLSSLARLAGRLPGAESLALQLSQEIIQNHNKSAADACSPVSDHMSEVLDDSEPQFADEMDKILVRGNSMDQATLERLFERIMIRVEASWTKHASQVRTCALLLVRLKCFGIKQFEFLMAVWLRKLLLSPTRPPLVDVLGPLISVDCLDLREVITICTDFLENSLQGESFTPSRVADETLKLLLGTSYDANLMTSDDFYNLGIRRLRMHCDYPRETLSVIRRAIEYSTSLENEELFSVSSGCSERIRDVLRHMVLRDLGIVVEGLVAPLAKSSCMKAREQLSKLVQHLLECDDVKQAEIQTVAYRVEHTLRLADDLTLPFCQLELQSIFADHVFDWSGEDCDSTEYLEAFERAVDFAVENNNRSWTSIIPLLDIQIARHLCQRAESLLLQLFPPPRPEDSGSPETLENYNVAKRLLFIIDATAYSMQGNRTPYLAPQIVEKLNDIWQISSQGSPHSQNVVIEQWLPLMLDFVTLHIGLFDCGKNSSELRSRILLALSSLLLELQIHPNANVLLLQQIFDVGILLVDDLPEDARLNCARSLKDKVSDPGIQYIFGFSASSVDWLQLSQKGKVVSYPLRRWEILSEPTPNVGENDTSLSLTLFGARKI